MTSFKDFQNQLKEEDPLDYFLLETVGKLMAARDRKKITQRELSEITGIPQKTISRIENGKDIPKLTTLFKLAEALQLEFKIMDKNFNDETSATTVN